MPLNGEGDGRVEKNVVIECSVCVFPKVVCIDQQEFSDGLPKADVELVARVGRNIAQPE